MDERRLTFIVVPHGDLETRTFEVSYRRLKVLMVAGFALLVLFIVMASSWWYVAAQAARVPGLEREMTRLEDERGKVAELARTLGEVEAQYERVRQILGADAVPRGRQPLLPPLRADLGQEELRAEAGASAAALETVWPLTQSGFVTRKLIRDEGEAHPGLDIAVPHDSYVRAAGAGLVRAAGEDDVYGQYVLIDHPGGYQTMYGHASRLFVAAGDSVEPREVIALTGSTGRSTAPHLHFEVRKDGTAVDPLSLVRQP